MKLSDAEWTVMNVVWDRGPVSARDVMEVVETDSGWAYTTVKTMLTRLVEKGALRLRKRANAGVFEPLITRAQARRSAVHGLLERAFDGAFGSLVQHMVTQERLSAAERRQLLDMLEKAERGQKK